MNLRQRILLGCKILGSAAGISLVMALVVFWTHPKLPLAHIIPGLSNSATSGQPSPEQNQSHKNLISQNNQLPGSTSTPEANSPANANNNTQVTPSQGIAKTTTPGASAQQGANNSSTTKPAHPAPTATATTNIGVQAGPVHTSVQLPPPTPTPAPILNINLPFHLSISI